MAIECKWRDKDFDPTNTRVFLRYHDKAIVYVAAHNVGRPYNRTYGDFTVKFINLTDLTNILTR